MNGMFAIREHFLFQNRKEKFPLIKNDTYDTLRAFFGIFFLYKFLVRDPEKLVLFVLLPGFIDWM